MNTTDYDVFLAYSKEDKAWLARVDLLPGCIVDGATREEALSRVNEAIEIWIETSKELGRVIPRALDIEEIEEIGLKAAKAQQNEIVKATISAIKKAAKNVSVTVVGDSFKHPSHLGKWVSGISKPVIGKEIKGQQPGNKGIQAAHKV